MLTNKVRNDFILTWQNALICSHKVKLTGFVVQNNDCIQNICFPTEITSTCSDVSCKIELGNHPDFYVFANFFT